MGDAEAQFNYGTLLTAEGEESSADWFRQAAQQGHAPGMHNLVCCLEQLGSSTNGTTPN